MASDSLEKLRSSQVVSSGSEAKIHKRGVERGQLALSPSFMLVQSLALPRSSISRSLLPFRVLLANDAEIPPTAAPKLQQSPPGLLSSLGLGMGSNLGHMCS